MSRHAWEAATVQALLDLFRGAYQAKFDLPLKTVRGRDEKFMRTITATYGAERTARMIATFFRSTDAWVRQSDYSMRAFHAVAEKMALREKFGDPQPVTQSDRNLEVARQWLDEREKQRAAKQLGDRS
jgi:hypothetical protein